MCGICGRFNFDKDNKVNIEEIKAMAKRIEHRGPDGEGYFRYSNIGLGHKRLSIIDIDNGQQPMYSFDNNFVIVYNGEIYNYLELRQQLIIKGYRFKTHTDTEVLLNLYIEYGEGCLDKLNGMFSFAIYDKNNNILFCARDRMGEKPFYYYLDEESFVFASEIKSIFAVQGIQPNLNESSLIDYLSLQMLMGDKTLYKGVMKLLPGHYMIIKDKKITIKEYWDINYNIDDINSEDYFADRLMLLIEDSIRLRLRSDVSLGTYLSGGLDSTLVSCVASQLLNSKINTFTGAFSEGQQFDESYYAKLVSKTIESKYSEIRPTADDFIKDFENIIYFMDEPTAGPGVFPQYYTSKLASQNVKVVLGGQGGDEIFGGYIRYLIAYFEQCIKGAIFETNEEGKFVVDIYSIINSLPHMKGYSPLLKKFWSNGLFEPMNKRYFSLIQRIDAVEGLFDSELFNTSYDCFNEFNRIFNNSNTKSYFNKMTYFDTKIFLPALLQIEDRTSMAHSLESRLPLLDYRIVELMAKIPPTMKFKEGNPKYMLKKSIKNIIPMDILNRKDKMGFPVPLTKWYKNELKEYIQDMLSNGELVKRNIVNSNKLNKLVTSESEYGRSIWGLLCLEVFLKNMKSVM